MSFKYFLKICLFLLLILKVLNRVITYSWERSSDCPLGQGGWADESCYVCDSNCLKCKGPTNNNRCYACNVGYYLVGQSDDLEKSSYDCSNNFNCKCLKCDDSCTGGCKGTATDCCHSTCKHGCISGDPPEERCYSCKDVYYEYWIGDYLYKCRDCDVSCQGCTGIGATKCKDCKPNYYKQGSAVPYTCLACDSSCLGCTGAGNENCQSCATQNYRTMLESGSFKCSSNCDEGYYISGGDCLKCDSACKGGCTGSGNTKCNDCEINYLKEGLIAPFTCKTCHSNCLGCFVENDINQCKDCKIDFFKQLITGAIYSCTPCHLACKSGCNKVNDDTACNDCADGFIKSGSGPPFNCFYCDESCDGCSVGKDNNKCLNCKSTYLKTILDAGEFKCTSNCDVGYYKSGSDCLKCDISCSPGCSAAGYNKCSGCSAQYYVSFQTINDKTCTPCNNFCNGCSGPTRSHCKDCAANKYKTGPFGVNNYFDCDDQCSQNYYPNDFICTLCDNKCSGCVGAGSTNCKNCKPNHFKTGADPAFTCTPCHIGCSECTAPNDDTKCVNCASNNLKTILDDGGVKCTSNCDVGYYQSGSDCLKCDISCKSGCTGAGNTNCNDCVDNYFKSGASVPYSCVTCHSHCSGGCEAANDDSKCLNCIEGYYKTSTGTSTFQCSACDISCSPGCSASGNTKCSGCSAQYYVSDEGGSDKICTPCNNLCNGCSGPTSSHCKDCAANKYKTGLNAPFKCAEACDADYYANDFICTLCDNKCSGCVGAGSTNCKSCKANHFKEGTSPSFTCTPCDKGCSECTAANDNTKCVSCAVNNFKTILDAGGFKCTSNCDIGYYQSGSDCLKCDVSCKSGCTGTGNTKCNDCVDNYYKDGTSPPVSCFACDSNCKNGCSSPSDNTKCVDCNINSYKSGSSSPFTCTKCDSSCKIGSGCTGLGNTKCIECEATYLKTIITESNFKCTNTCDDDHFQIDSQNCGLCDESCNKCSAAGNLKCKDCKINYFKSGTGPNDYTCTPCHKNCNNGCSMPNDNTQCKDCESNFLKTGNSAPYKCSSICDLGYYKSENNCVLCDESCRNGCTGAGNTKCKDCKDNYFKTGDGPDFFTCTACDSSCKTCLGLGNKNCKVCLDNFLRTNTQEPFICTEICGINYYQSKSDCLPCHESCKNGCSGADNTKCNDCNIDYFKIGTVTPFTCLACDSSCLNGCTLNNNSTQCNDCKDGYFKTGISIPYKCSVKCDLGYYENNKVCSLCDKNCTKGCIGEGNNNCNDCAYNTLKTGTAAPFKCTPCDNSCKNGCIFAFNNSQCNDCAESYLKTGLFIPYRCTKECDNGYLQTINECYFPTAFVENKELNKKINITFENNQYLSKSKENSLKINIDPNLQATSILLNNSVILKESNSNGTNNNQVIVNIIGGNLEEGVKMNLSSVPTNYYKPVFKILIKPSSKKFRLLDAAPITEAFNTTIEFEKEIFVGTDEEIDAELLDNDRTDLIVGLTVGLGGFFLILIVLGIVFLIKKNKKQSKPGFEQVESHSPNSPIKEPKGNENDNIKENYA